MAYAAQAVVEEDAERREQDGDEDLEEGAAGRHRALDLDRPGDSVRSDRDGESLLCCRRCLLRSPWGLFVVLRNGLRSSSSRRRAGWPLDRGEDDG
jgi:hypothetical protein